MTADQNHLPPGPENAPASPRFNWWLLLALLLAPAVLTALTVLVDGSSDGPAPGVASIGGLLGGIGCGVLLGRRFGRTTATRVLLGFIFAGGCVMASVAIAMFGCLASGYDLNIH